jgi:predicted Zn-dependent protease
MKKSEIYMPKVQAQPDNMLFRFSLGQALYEEGSVSESIPHLQRCVDSQVDWMLPRILLGKAFLQSGETERAKPILENALQLAIEQNHEGPEGELREIIADF